MDIVAVIDLAEVEPTRTKMARLLVKLFPKTVRSFITQGRDELAEDIIYSMERRTITIYQIDGLTYVLGVVSYPDEPTN